MFHSLDIIWPTDLMVYSAASVSSVTSYLLGCSLSHRYWPFTSHGRDAIVSGAHGSRLDVVERL
jgi:hypothetical protein